MYNCFTTILNFIDFYTNNTQRSRYRYNLKTSKDCVSVLMVNQVWGFPVTDLGLLCMYTNL
jgi:hypothetical protein